MSPGHLLEGARDGYALELLSDSEEAGLTDSGEKAAPWVCDRHFYCQSTITNQGALSRIINTQQYLMLWQPELGQI